MALNAIVIRNKSSAYYSASRPLHCLLADGTQAGITAGLKGAGCGLQLIACLGPDGGSAVANWKTAPLPGVRNTLYQGGAVGAASVTGWIVIETPHMWRLIVETTGPVGSANSFKFGEVIVAHDSSLGESTSLGNADGRTMYGMFSGSPVWVPGSQGEGASSSPQSKFFIGAESTVRFMSTLRDHTSESTSTIMVPTGYATGDWLDAGGLVSIITSSFRVGHPSYDQICKQGAHASSLTVSSQSCRRIGASTTGSYLVTTPVRKPGASPDTLVITRTVATYADWTVFLQAVWDYFATGTYWEQDSSA